MKCNKSLARSLAFWKRATPIVTVVLAFGASAAAQTVRFPVFSAAGRGHVDGSVTVLGQLAIGRVSNDGLVAEQGAVVCWDATNAPCEGDVSGDGQVDLYDLSTLLSHFGITDGASREHGDLDGDGSVDLVDLTLLLSRFGLTCP